MSDASPDPTVVIAFPMTEAAAARKVARVQRAMDALVRASEEQRAAVALWRENLAVLHGAVSRLSGSLQDYRGALGTTADRVRGLAAEAAKLEQIVTRA